MKRKSIREALSASAIYVATCALIFSSSPVQAQMLGANLTARTGIAVADVVVSDWKGRRASCPGARGRSTRHAARRGTRVPNTFPIRGAVGCDELDSPLVGRNTARWSAEDNANVVVADEDTSGWLAAARETLTDLE